MKQKIYSQNEAISLLAKATGMTFSKEQLAVLSHQYDVPTLISASAGSGKTTIFILSTLVNILTGRSDASSVLGITFSKKAQLDMVSRYDKYVDGLDALGVDIIGTPYFSTFHAFFYDLLRHLPSYADVTVLPSYGEHTNELIKVLVRDDDSQLSNSEYLTNVMGVYERIMNMGQSLDGVTIRKVNKPINLIDSDELFTLLKIRDNQDFLDNYVRVVSRYNDIKREKQQVDFNDMKMHLLRIMGSDNKSRDIILALTQQYKLVVVDEFQDIDNIQNYLLTQLLTPETYSHIVAIGDDDQNIYSFRGSNSDYILNFKRDHERAVVLPLSTNYRTGGHILDKASGVIENNVKRQDKTLRAYNADIGKVSMYGQSGQDFEPDSPFLKELLYVLQTRPEDTTAVLVRYNIDRSLVADWLVGEGQEPNINSLYTILQKNVFYQAQVGIINALFYDDLLAFLPLAKRVGYSTLESYIRKVIADSHVGSITEYLDLAEKSSGGLSGYKLHQVHEINTQLRTIIEKSWRLRQVKFDTSAEVRDYLWSSVKELTSGYFKYMFKQHIMSKTKHDRVLNYVHAIYRQTANLEDYFVQEERKLQKLTDIVQSSKVKQLEVLSLHQSKGLEFDNVFLYGLTREQISEDDYAFWSDFDASLSDSDLFNWFAQRVVISGGSHSGIKSTLTELIPQLSPTMQEQIADAGLASLIALIMGDETASDEFRTDFIHEIRQLGEVSVAHLEEERRLLYVGMTRARRYLCVNAYGGASSGLLQEIDVETLRDNQHQLTVANPLTENKPSNVGVALPF